MQLKPTGAMNAPKASKINWTAIIGALAAIGVVFGVVFGVEVAPEQQAAIIAGILAVQNVAIVVFRTFMTEPG